MEHRETPWIVTGAGKAQSPAGDPVAGRRFARFVPSTSVRRLVPSRVGMVLFVLVLSLLAGSWLRQEVVYWLHTRTVYMIDFEDMTLDPPPPAWIKGGPAEFLRRIRERNHRPKSESVLEIDLKALDLEFRREPWVKSVGRIHRVYPNRLIVPLVYREPVARTNVSRDRRLTNQDAAIDEEGVFLPPEEVDWDYVRPVIFLENVEHPPLDPTPGTAWKSSEAERGIATPDKRIQDAARLAAFLKSVQAKTEAEPQRLRFLSVYPSTLSSGLSTSNEEKFLVLWTEAPGSEGHGQPSAETKWKWLRDWLEQNKVLDTRRTFLTFTKTGVILKRR